MQKLIFYRLSKRRRKGATVLELSFSLLLFLMITLGIIDFGVGVFRYHIVSQAARHAARQAAVHGAMADPLGKWGPGAISVNANATGIPIISEIQNMLVTCDLAKTQIDVVWPSGSNEVDEQVTVTVSTKFKPTTTFIIPSVEKTLSASTTMRIAH